MQGLLERVRNHGKLSRKTKFLILSLVPIYFIVVGFVVQPWGELWHGMATIIKEPDFLITDYIEIGGMGAAFFNAGILTLISIAIIYFLKMEMDGHTITSCFLMFGFSLFGKNILNIWTILLGIWLYARYHNTSITKYIYIGFYGTSLSPIITQIMQITQIPVAARLPLSLMVGLMIGFVLPPLSTHVYYTHKGYSHYNVGFASGIIATIIVSVFKSYGIETKSRLIWSTGNNELLLVLLMILFTGMIVTGMAASKHIIREYHSVLKTYGLGGTDYVESHGLPVVLFNMGINGIMSTLLVVIIGGDLNGPTIGGIFTIVGFSATGKHLRNTLPVMAGVLLAGVAKSWSSTDPGPMLALLFSTTLAPVAGEFGIAAGILAGFLHSSVALNVGLINGGMNLYNNGFAGGIIATFLVPVIQSIKDKRARAKGNISL